MNKFCHVLFGFNYKISVPFSQTRAVQTSPEAFWIRDDIWAFQGCAQRVPAQKCWITTGTRKNRGEGDMKNQRDFSCVGGKHVTVFQVVQKHEEKANAWSDPDLLPIPKCVYKWTCSVWQLWECHRTQLCLGNPHVQQVSTENTCSIKWILITGWWGFTRCVLYNSWNRYVNPPQKSGQHHVFINPVGIRRAG